jgi:hypothetical protein
MRTLKFNRSHKNGWISYKLAGVPGSVFVDGRMLTEEGRANPNPTLDIEVNGMLEEGADASAAAAARAEKKAEAEAKKAERVAAQTAKAAARLEKLQEAAKKAQDRANAVAAKAGVAAPAEVAAE